MRKSIIFLILAVSLFLLTGCNNTGGGVVCEDTFFVPVLPSPDDDWWIVEFPNDSFPDEIIFETEFGTYSPDTEIITATLTNAATDPRYSVRHDQGYSVVRQVGNEWRIVPIFGGTFDAPASRSIGESVSVSIFNECYDGITVIVRIGNSFTHALFTHEYQFTPGTYRIINNTALLRREDGVVWSGRIWAEFVIEG